MVLESRIITQKENPVKIDHVSTPNVQGMNPIEALNLLADHSHGLGVQVMMLSRELESLKQRIVELERNQRKV